MQERIHGKLGNKGDNAFKLRKFAKMYDTDHSGQVICSQSVGKAEIALKTMKRSQHACISPKLQSKVCILDATCCL